jgi:chemotaxis protein methyltransferase CheR
MTSAPSCSVDDFEFVRKLVHDESSIALEEGKEYLVEARLGPLARQEGVATVSSLIGLIRAGASHLTGAVVEAMTTNETSFFRDVHPFDALRTDVIPRVLHANGGSSLAMWSAATATGQEAYSMALVVREHFPQIPKVTILGTDVSQGVLDRARTGRFTQMEVNRGLPASLLVRYFSQDGLEWRLDESVRRMVTFRQVNIAQSLAGVPSMDVVFLRNVLIYFDPETKRSVLGEVARILRPGGFLFLGGPETTYGIDPSYERVEVGRSVCYRLRKREGS